MVGWHHRLNGHEFGQAPGDDDGQGGLTCCSPWGRKQSDTTEQLNFTELMRLHGYCRKRAEAFELLTASHFFRQEKEE